ncbi:MAG: exodeoxyribonuclease VII small subunit [Streptococcaceae bacterium]|jgi:exodeoxyribonuclease VII small subunit|nr:exodeoxyribonuclease VII small subunit [Streptococcaceae bacterium]
MAKTFEESLNDLETLVSKLEQGEVPLEEALTTFKQGMRLSKELTDTLKKAEKTLAKIMNEEGLEVPFKEGP